MICFLTSFTEALTSASVRPAGRFGSVRGAVYRLRDGDVGLDRARGELRKRETAPGQMHLPARVDIVGYFKFALPHDFFRPSLALVSVYSSGERSGKMNELA